MESPPSVGHIAVAYPGLLVFDVSWSTAGFIDKMNAAVARFADKLRVHPDVASTAWLGLVSFADDARTELPLARWADPTVKLPELSCRGQATDFAAAFTETLARLRADLPTLTHTDGGTRRVHRPTIYLVTDGYHNTAAGWRAVLQELRTRSWRPNIFVFGYGDADRDVCRQIASEGCAYFAKDGQDPDTMFDAILTVILRSIISIHLTGPANAVAPPPNPADDPATKALQQLAANDPIGDID